MADAASALQARREALARLIAAELGGLVLDPCGERLPDELWTQALGRADAVLVLVGARAMAAG